MSLEDPISDFVRWVLGGLFGLLVVLIGVIYGINAWEVRRLRDWKHNQYPHDISKIQMDVAKLQERVAALERTHGK